ncbi:hypothetical protein ACN47E_005368 [Coniothyrium glycines]
MSKPHSKTVRGTLDNPKTQEAIKNNKPIPRLGDPTSLKPETDDKPLPPNDSVPPSGQGNDKPSSSSDPGAPTVSAPYKNNGTSAGGPDKRAKGNGRGERSSSSREDLPHSKKVRGTLANDDGKKVNRTQLGDPASLKAETSNTKLGPDVEREGQQKTKSKL